MDYISHTPKNKILSNRKVHVKFPPKIDTNKQFNIARPAFLDGTVVDNFVNVKDLSKQVPRVGNYEINRPAFEAPSVQARNSNNFASLSVTSLQDALRTTSYDKKVYINDAADIDWLQERARLVSELKLRFAAMGTSAEILALINKELLTNLPLGREQRKISTLSSDVTSQGDIDKKQQTESILNDIKLGRADSVVNQRALTLQLTKILADVNSVNTMTKLELSKISDGLKALGFPSSYLKLGLPRVMDIEYFKKNSGIIISHLISNSKFNSIAGKYDIEKPVKDYSSGDADGLPAIRLLTAITLMNKPSRMATRSTAGKSRLFLDLDGNGVINDAILKRDVNVNGGYDITMINGKLMFEIDIANRPI